MPLPISASLPLWETVRFLMEITGESEDRVRVALTEAGLTGAITATGCLHLSTHADPVKYFAHQALNKPELVPPEDWGTTISWLESRIGRYDLVRLNRVNIERWLAAAATNGDEHPREETPSPRPKKGNRQTKQDTLATWLRDRYEARPAMSVDELMRIAQNEAPHVGTFGRRTFEAALSKAFP